MAICYDENLNVATYFCDSINVILTCKGEKIMEMIERGGDIKCSVTKIMLELGMPAHLRGYHYLREAILLTLDNMELVGSVTKLLYPEIAKSFQTTNIKVERAIRSVIEIGWERGNEELYEEIFGYSRVHGKTRPTNSELILGIAVWYTIS